MPAIPIEAEALQRIFKASARRLLALAVEGEEDLLRVVYAKAEAAQEKNSEKLKVVFSHRIEIDFTKGKVRDTLGAPLRVELVREGELDDPDQGQLFGEEMGDEE
jgi:hypothetical protein